MSKDELRCEIMQFSLHNWQNSLQIPFLQNSSLCPHMKSKEPKTMRLILTCGGSLNSMLQMAPNY